jgi:hypothetical protein
MLELAKGEPLTPVYTPLVGSYQRAEARPESFDISTVTVRGEGMYTMTREPSEVRAAAAYVLPDTEARLVIFFNAVNSLPRFPR